MIARLFAVIALLALAACVRVPPNARYFDHAEIAPVASGTMPMGDWQSGALPTRWFAHASPLWVRVRFDAAPFGGRRIALFSDRIRERYEVYLNGVDIARSNADRSDRSFGWHRPLFVAFPERLLRPHGNVVTGAVSLMRTALSTMQVAL